MLPPSGQISKLCRTYSRRGAANNKCERTVERSNRPGYRAMAQSVSRRHITAEVRVRSQASPCGICGGQSGRTGSLPPRPDYFDFSCQCHSSNPYTFSHLYSEVVLSKELTVNRQVHKHTKSPTFNPLKPELNPICYLLALLGVHHFLHVSRIRVKLLTLRRRMSYIYIYIWSTHSWCF